MRLARLITCGFLVASAGCTDPTVADIVQRDSGLVYTAEPSVPTGSSLFRVEVRVSNSTSSRITLSYRSDCSVAIRLYNLRQERVYDEARPCESLNVVTISVGPGDYTTLNTGYRTTRAVFGDSIPRGTYRVRAAIGIEGGGWFEVPAGSLVYTPNEND